MTSRVGPGYFLLFSLLGVACGDGDGDGKGATCAQVCRRMEAPACANAAPNCIASCEEEKLNTSFDCEPQLDALTSCFASASFQCDENGVPVAKACERHLNRWLACAGEDPVPVDGDEDEGEGTEGPDKDEGDGEGGLCQAAPDDDTCDSCLKASCCDETLACGPACQRIANCVEECPDDACIDACVSENLDGAYQFAQLGTCMVQSCAGSCNLDG